MVTLTPKSWREKKDSVSPQFPLSFRADDFKWRHRKSLTDFPDSCQHQHLTKWKGNAVEHEGRWRLAVMETINTLVQHHRSITSQLKLRHDSDSVRLSDGWRVLKPGVSSVPSVPQDTSNCGVRLEKTQWVYFVIWCWTGLEHGGFLSSYHKLWQVHVTHLFTNHAVLDGKPTAPRWPSARGLKPHKLHIWLCILLYLLTLCQASVNKVKHSLSFVHILQMNSNSALQDHRYCSIDIKCIQAAQWTETWRATETAGEEMLLPPGRSTL